MRFGSGVLPKTKGWEVKTGQCSSSGGREMRAEWLRRYSLTSGGNAGCLHHTCHRETKITLEICFGLGRSEETAQLPAQLPGLWLLWHFAGIKSRETPRSKITTRNQVGTTFVVVHHNLPQCPAFARVFSLTLKQAWLAYLGNDAQPSNFTSTQPHTWLKHTANDLPAEWTITSWFWQSFAAGVRKETFPKVLAEEMGDAC